MSISYNGFNTKVLTFEGKNISTDCPVQINNDGTIKNAVSNADFIGVCVSKNGDFAGVQLEGYVEVSYSGTAPAYGYATLAADGNGGVKASDDGISHLVIKLDTVNHIVGIIL